MRRLMFECEWDCYECGYRIRIRTFQAIIDGDGQLMVCAGCERPYVVKRDGAQALDRIYVPDDVRALKPLPSSIGLLQPPHAIQTLPFDPNVCYVCGVLVKEHPPQQ